MADNKVTFKWLNGDVTSDEIHAASTFFCKLVNLVKVGKRINSMEHDDPSEKYAFRCFLLRLGFIGDEYKKDRKILMQNLTGSSAFRKGEEDANQ